MKRITRITVERSSVTGDADETNDYESYDSDNIQGINDINGASMGGKTIHKKAKTNMMESDKNREDNIYEIVDVSVTDDNGEICGCFVSLNNTPNAIAFWKTVQEQHR